MELDERNTDDGNKQYASTALDEGVAEGKPRVEGTKSPSKSVVQQVCA
jgi:hypothetical protein